MQLAHAEQAAMAVVGRLQSPQARDMHKIVMCCLVIPGSGIFSPAPPVTEPNVSEGRFPGRTFDEAQLGCVAMVCTTQGAQTDCLAPGGGTPFPPYISPEPRVVQPLRCLGIVFSGKNVCCQLSSTCLLLSPGSVSLGRLSTAKP